MTGAVEGKRDVTYIQETMWKVGETIGDKEGRMDVCVAAAGILRPDKDCLEYDAKTFQEVVIARMSVILPADVLCSREVG